VPPVTSVLMVPIKRKLSPALQVMNALQVAVQLKLATQANINQTKCSSSVKPAPRVTIVTNQV
jgi:hypothetical protein